MRKERLYEALKKVLEIDPDNITVHTIEWQIAVLSHIRDLWYEEKIDEVIDAIEDWAEWREKNVEKGLPAMLWEIKKETWRIRAERRGWDYISTAVVRDFANELASITTVLKIEKIGEIYSLLALALKRNQERTLDLLIKFMDYYYGDIDALRDELKDILDTKEEKQKDRKALLLKLCEELTNEVENLYDKFEVVLCSIAAVVAWADRNLQEDVMLTVHDGFRTLDQSRLKRLSEEISKIVKEVVQEQTLTDELP